MANGAVFRPARLLVLTAFAVHLQVHASKGDDMMQQLISMRNQAQQDQAPQPAAPAGQQGYSDTQPSAAEQAYYDSQPSDAAATAGGYSDAVEDAGDAAMTTHKPAFLTNQSPKNRAIITGVVAGAGVAAVAGGIAIAIEENKIQKNIKEGRPVKPIFPFLAPKDGEESGSQPATLPPWPTVPPEPPQISARQSDGGPPRISARQSDGGTDAPTSPPPTTPAPTLPPTTPTTTPIPKTKLGDEIPLGVWIALAVLACCCLAALICACVEAMRNGGRKKKRSALTKREVSRSDSVSSYEDGSYYSDAERSYAAVSPQEGQQYYDPNPSQYSYDYSQNGSYQTTGQPSYADYTPQASYALTDASQYSMTSAQSYVPSLHQNPHPNAVSYVHPDTGHYHYNTNG